MSTDTEYIPKLEVEYYTMNRKKVEFPKEIPDFLQVAEYRETGNIKEDAMSELPRFSSPKDDLDEMLNQFDKEVSRIEQNFGDLQESLDALGSGLSGPKKIKTPEPAFSGDLDQIFADFDKEVHRVLNDVALEYPKTPAARVPLQPAPATSPAAVPPEREFDVLGIERSLSPIGISETPAEQEFDILTMEDYSPSPAPISQAPAEQEFDVLAVEDYSPSPIPISQTPAEQEFDVLAVEDYSPSPAPISQAPAEQEFDVLAVEDSPAGPREEYTADEETPAEPVFQDIGDALSEQGFKSDSEENALSEEKLKEFSLISNGHQIVYEDFTPSMPTEAVQEFLAREISENPGGKPVEFVIGKDFIEDIVSPEEEEEILEMPAAEEPAREKPPHGYGEIAEEAASRPSEPQEEEPVIGGTFITEDDAGSVTLSLEEISALNTVPLVEEGADESPVEEILEEAEPAEEILPSQLAGKPTWEEARFDIDTRAEAEILARFSAANDKPGSAVSMDLLAQLDASLATSSSSITKLSREELATVMGEVDNLLEYLPNHKIEELAHKDFYFLYLRLMDDLGL